MEYLWLVSVGTLLVGGVIGFFFGRSSLGNRKQAVLAEELESSKNELEKYKADVSEHFEKTAELVGNLTQSYKDVHQHLAGGAQNLCNLDSVDLMLAAALQPKLEQEVSSEPEKTETPVEEPNAENAEESVAEDAQADPEENKEQSPAAEVTEGEKIEPTMTEAPVAEPPLDYAPKSSENDKEKAEKAGEAKEKSKDKVA